MTASGGRVSSDLPLFFRIWKMKHKLPLSCWTQVFTTHPFFLFYLSLLPIAEYLCSLSVSPLGAKDFTGLCGVGLLGKWEGDTVRGPSVLDPALEGVVGRFRNVLCPPFPPSSFPKMGLDVGC